MKETKQVLKQQNTTIAYHDFNCCTRVCFLYRKHANSNASTHESKHTGAPTGHTLDHNMFIGKCPSVKSAAKGRLERFDLQAHVLALALVWCTIYILE